LVPTSRWRICAEEERDMDADGVPDVYETEQDRS
jgi:hypothetical protein